MKGTPLFSIVIWMHVRRSLSDSEVKSKENITSSSDCETSLNWTSKCVWSTGSECVMAIIVKYEDCIHCVLIWCETGSYFMHLAFILLPEFLISKTNSCQRKIQLVSAPGPRASDSIYYFSGNLIDWFDGNIILWMTLESLCLLD